MHSVELFTHGRTTLRPAQISICADLSAAKTIFYSRFELDGAVDLLETNQPSLG